MGHVKQWRILMMMIMMMMMMMTMMMIIIIIMIIIMIMMIMMIIMMIMMIEKMENPNICFVGHVGYTKGHTHEGTHTPSTHARTLSDYLCVISPSLCLFLSLSS